MLSLLRSFQVTYFAHYVSDCENNLPYYPRKKKLKIRDYGFGFKVHVSLEIQVGFCFINVVLQLSHLSTKEAAVELHVPDKDSNIINRATDGLVGLFYFSCKNIFALLYTI